MIKYIDNGILCGWYFCNDGEYYGDGTKAEAIRVQTVFKMGLQNVIDVD